MEKVVAHNPSIHPSHPCGCVKTDQSSKPTNQTTFHVYPNPISVGNASSFATLRPPSLALSGNPGRLHVSKRTGFPCFVVRERTRIL